MLHHLARSVAHRLASAAFPAGIALLGLSAPALAVLTAEDTLLAETADAAPASPASPDRAPPPAPQTRGQEPAVDAAAGRIRYLHDRLRITPAQEPLWANLAQVMRENAKAVAPLVRERLQTEKNRTAVETLDNYEKLGEVQLDGLRKFLVAFRALYNALSDEQKRIADSIFRTSPLSMIGDIPPRPEQLIVLPPEALYTYGGAYGGFPSMYGAPSGAAPSSRGGTIFQPRQYDYGRRYPVVPTTPYYVPGLGPPLIGAPPFLLPFARRFHNRPPCPAHPPTRSGASAAAPRAPLAQPQFHAP